MPIERRGKGRLDTLAARVGVILLVGIAVATGSLLAAPGHAQSAAPTDSEATLTWRPCYGDAECADLPVPVDYADPSAGATTIAILRVKAADPHRRQGSLVVNPGGPGVPGRAYATSLAFSLPTSITTRYDIVGFDPRGTGGSHQVRCQGQRDLAPWLRADATPDSRAEQRTFTGLARDFADACAARTGMWLGHVGTRNTARDLDLLREALGDERLNFLGASYGTYLGALYADAFPQHVGRMVLDGAVDPSDDLMGLTQTQIQGFDEAATRMARSCAASRDCPVAGPGTRGVLASINRLLASLDSATIPSSSGPALTQQAATAAILAALYDESTWDYVLKGLAEAIDGDGQTLALFSRGFLTADARFLASFLAITCADSPRPPGPRSLGAWADRVAQGARVPEIARYLAWSVVPCSVWPVDSDATVAPVSAGGAAPVLVIGTRHDPATPWESARALARQLPGSVLLTYDGDGHTAIGRGSQCIDRAVATYLVRGVLPEPGTTCR